MTTKNDITGDEIKSKSSNKAFEEGYDRIFGKKLWGHYDEHGVWQRDKFCFVACPPEKCDCIPPLNHDKG